MKHRYCLFDMHGFVEKGFMLANKTIVVTGVANAKSIAWHVAKV